MLENIPQCLMQPLRDSSLLTEKLGLLRSQEHDLVWWGFIPLLHEDGQAGEQEPGEAAEPPNSEIFRSHVDQALSSVV